MVLLIYFLAPMRNAYAAQGTEFFLEDDLTVLGTDGTWPDADLEVFGFSMFGKTGAMRLISEDLRGSVGIAGGLQVGGTIYGSSLTLNSQLYVNKDAMTQMAVNKDSRILVQNSATGLFEYETLSNVITGGGPGSGAVSDLHLPIWREVDGKYVDSSITESDFGMAKMMTIADDVAMNETLEVKKDAVLDAKLLVKGDSQIGEAGAPVNVAINHETEADTGLYVKAKEDGVTKYAAQFFNQGNRRIVFMRDTELGVDDDLTVMGSNGTYGDPDLEVKGFSMFGGISLSSPRITEDLKGSAAIGGGLQVDGTIYGSSMTLNSQLYINKTAMIQMPVNKDTRILVQNSDTGLFEYQLLFNVVSGGSGADGIVDKAIPMWNATEGKYVPSSMSEFDYGMGLVTVASDAKITGNLEVVTNTTLDGTLLVKGTAQFGQDATRESVGINTVASSTIALDVKAKDNTAGTVTARFTAGDGSEIAFMSNSVLGVDDDLTVQGTNGTYGDADVEIYGLTVLGPARPASTRITGGTVGSLIVTGSIEVGGAAYLPALANIMPSDLSGNGAKVLRVNTVGNALEYVSVDAMISGSGSVDDKTVPIWNDTSRKYVNSAITQDDFGAGKLMTIADDVRMAEKLEVDKLGTFASDMVVEGYLRADNHLGVFGQVGTAAGPDVEIKGFTVFGPTQSAYTGMVPGAGNVVVNGYLAVSSGAYFVGASTFTSAQRIFINDGNPGQLLTKTAPGNLDWVNSSAIGDNLGNHVAATTLNMSGNSIINAASGTFTAGITASSFTASGASLGVDTAKLRFTNNNIVVSSASAAQSGGIYVSTNIYLPAGAKYYGDGSGLTGIASYYYVTRTLKGAGTTVGIGMFSGNNGNHSLYVSVSVSESYSWSATKQYIIPITYDLTGSNWRDVLPISNTVADPSNDFVLEVNVGPTIASLRLRRTAGSADGSAAISLEQIGPSADVFTPVSDAGSSAPNPLLSVTPLTQVGGKVGIGTGSPATTLHISSGTMTIDGNAANSIIVNGNVGIGTTGPSSKLHISSGILTVDGLGAGITTVGGLAAASGMFTNGVTAASFTATGAGLGVDTAKVSFTNSNIIVSSASSAQYGGVYVSTNVYLTTGAKYYGDGSTLDGVSTQTFKIGDSFGGGKIFWIDPSGKQVLIAATADQSTSVQWGKNTNFTGANADGVYAGKANTVTISTMQGSGSYAAQVCSDYAATVNGEYYDDWYLPSIAELQLLYTQKGTVGGFYDANYWSSNEYVTSTGLAWYIYFGGGGVSDVNKADSLNVRCVRAGPSSGIGNSPNLLIGTQTFTGANTFELGVTASSFTATGAASGVDTAKLRFTDNNIVVSSASSAQGGGIYVSTNIYLPAGAKYYGDGSGLTNLNPANLAPGVAYLAGTQTFTGANVFASTTSFTAANATLPGVDISSGLIVRAGNVGIGTTSPNRSLQIERSANAASEQLRLATKGGINESDYDGIEFFQDNGTFGQLGYIRLNYHGDGSTDLSLGTRPSGYGDNRPATEKVRIVNDGYVGIGTASPATKLHISSGTLTIDGNAANSIIVNGNIGIGTDTPKGLLHVGAGATPGLLVTSDGTVGISTAAPFSGGAKLVINGQIKITGGSPASGSVLASDGSGLAVWQNIAAAGIGDSLGNHVATTTLNMSGNQIVNMSTMVVTGLNGGIVLLPYINAAKIYAYSGGIAIGSDTYNNYSAGVGVGYLAASNYNSAVGVGDSAASNHDYGVGVGFGAANNNSSGVGVGVGATHNSNQGVGLGADASYNSNGGVGVGVNAWYNANYAVGIGAYSQNNQPLGSAFGAYSYAASSSTALGSNAKANAQSSVAIGNGTVNNSTGTASFGNYAVNTSSDLMVSGNVGIGTTSPAAKLDVSGDARIARCLTQAADAGIALTSADLGKTITINSASAQTVTLPSVGSSDIGAQVTILKLGSGTVTVQASSGTYIADSTNGGSIYNNATSPAYASVTLRLATSTRWMLTGGDGAWITQ